MVHFSELKRTPEPLREERNRDNIAGVFVDVLTVILHTDELDKDDDDEEEEEEEEDFGFLDEEELVSKKRRLFLRRLGSQFRVNARSEMDIEEEDALTFLCCKRLLIGKGHSSHRRCDVLSTKSTQKRGDTPTRSMRWKRRSMETNATIIALGGQ